MDILWALMSKEWEWLSSMNIIIVS